MDVRELQPNSMMIRMDILGDGDLRIVTAQHFSDDLTDEECHAYMAILTGLNAVLNMGTDFVMALGNMVTHMGDLEAEDEFIFEPDEELRKAVADAKVIPFDKNKIN